MSRRVRYVTRNPTPHESLLPASPLETLTPEQLGAWLREMTSFSRIVCEEWEPHIELAIQNEAIAEARRNGWL